MRMIDPTLVIVSQIPWVALWLGFAIFRVVPSFNLLGDGLGGLLDSYRS